MRTSCLILFILQIIRRDQVFQYSENKCLPHLRMKSVFCSDKDMERVELLFLSQKLWKMKVSTSPAGEEIYFPTSNWIIFIYLFIKYTSWEPQRFILLHALPFPIAKLCCFWGRQEPLLPWQQIKCQGKTVIFNSLQAFWQIPKHEICNPYLNAELQSMWGMCMQVLVSLGLRNKRHDWY